MTDECDQRAKGHTYSCSDGGCGPPNTWCAFCQLHFERIKHMEGIKLTGGASLSIGEGCQVRPIGESTPGTPGRSIKIRAGLGGGSVNFDGDNLQPGQIVCMRCNLSAPNGSRITCYQADCPRTLETE